MATATRDPAARDSVTSDPTPAELPAAPDRLHRITSDIYHEMGRHGLIRRADRVILLDGFLVKKMTQG
ncbi:MAG TPA: hypothetical protein VKP69_06495, partial [Isosphaeraceae bacterium]|nr:hypothetical protein [Isosphaeraceae bacterium]